MPYASKSIDSPVGRLKLVAGEHGLSAVLWPDDDPKRVCFEALSPQENHPLLCAAEAQLGEYFSGARREFDIPLDLQGTEFQKRVWHALLCIPFGETQTYGGIAQQIGRPTAVRAVGAANGRNPVSIIVPCHRVIGANGQLTGFAGGLAAKRCLLSLEERLR